MLRECQAGLSPPLMGRRSLVPLMWGSLVTHLLPGVSPFRSGCRDWSRTCAGQPVSQARLILSEVRTGPQDGQPEGSHAHTRTPSPPHTLSQSHTPSHAITQSHTHNYIHTPYALSHTHTLTPPDGLHCQQLTDQLQRDQLTKHTLCSKRLLRSSLK